MSRQFFFLMSWQIFLTGCALDSLDQVLGIGLEITGDMNHGCWMGASSAIVAICVDILWYFYLMALWWLRLTWNLCRFLLSGHACWEFGAYIAFSHFSNHSKDSLWSDKWHLFLKLYCNFPTWIEHLWGYTPFLDRPVSLSAGTWGFHGRDAPWRYPLRESKETRVDVKPFAKRHRFGW